MYLKSKDKSLFDRIILIGLLIVIVSCQTKPVKVSVAAAANLQVEEQGIVQIEQGYQDGRFTVKEVVQAYLDRIAMLDKAGPVLNSIISINPDAIQIAEELDRELKAWKSRGPMHGIPVILKDNIDTHDKMPTTAGSRALKNSYPLKDSFLAKRLREAGAVILGKANLSEWANFRGQMSTSG